MKKLQKMPDAERRLVNMMKVRKNSKRIIFVSLIVSVILCLAGFAVATTINISEAVTTINSPDAMLTDAQLSDNLINNSDIGTMVLDEKASVGTILADADINIKDTDTEGHEGLDIVDNEEIITGIYNFEGAALSITESAKLVIDNNRLNDRKSNEFSKWAASTSDAEMIDRDAILEVALPKVFGRAAISNAEPIDKVNIALVKYSNLVMSALSETGKPLTDIPVWVVTVEKINVYRRGGSISREEAVTALYDLHIVFDAYSGEELFSMAYGLD